MVTSPIDPSLTTRYSHSGLQYENQPCFSCRAKVEIPPIIPQPLPRSGFQFATSSIGCILYGGYSKDRVRGEIYKGTVGLWQNIKGMCRPFDIAGLILRHKNVCALPRFTLICGCWSRNQHSKRILEKLRRPKWLGKLMISSGAGGG